MLLLVVVVWRKMGKMMTAMKKKWRTEIEIQQEESSSTREEKREREKKSGNIRPMMKNLNGPFEVQHD